MSSTTASSIEGSANLKPDTVASLKTTRQLKIDISAWLLEHPEFVLFEIADIAPSGSYRGLQVLLVGASMIGLQTELPLPSNALTELQL